MTAGSTRHQLLQPVMAMLGFVQLLRDQWETLPADQRLRYLEVVERQGQRLAQLLSKLPDDLAALETDSDGPDPA